MPVYEYKCEECGLVFEAMQKFSDPPLTECRSCGGPVEKQISQTAFALKGHGWYQQGYSSTQAKPACPAAETGGGCGGCPKAANE
ncbi:MAG: zinc ribbon domain-containing protein [Syntrophotaleaceae bacterium]